MLRTLSTAASGMQAQETRMDLIANNLANVNTTGFKSSRGEFQDLFYETVRAPGTTAADGTQVPTGMQLGQGVRAVGTARNFTPGDLKQTDNPLDVAIEGAGFFQIMQQNGQLAYTRDGAFKSDAQGRLVNSDGLLVEPAIVLPTNAVRVNIAADGSVSACEEGQTQAVDIGRLNLATFANPAGLAPLGQNLFATTPASGEPIVGAPGDQGIGKVSQGFLEMSNVSVVEQMIELIATQRAYETNSKVIQAADEMLRSTANLR